VDFSESRRKKASSPTVTRKFRLVRPSAIGMISSSVPSHDGIARIAASSAGSVDACVTMAAER
jgi:hypothetical protein